MSIVMFIFPSRFSICTYRKITIISPGLILVQKGVLLDLFSEGLIIGKDFAFQNGLALTIKTA